MSAIMHIPPTCSWKEQMKEVFWVVNIIYKANNFINLPHIAKYTGAPTHTMTSWMEQLMTKHAVRLVNLDFAFEFADGGREGEAGVLLYWWAVGGRLGFTLVLEFSSAFASALSTGTGISLALQ